MKKFGLIGYPLGHSFSEKYFSEKFINEGLEDHKYELFPLQNLSDFLKLLKEEQELCGLNVTIPHKIGVMYYLDEVDPVAKEVDAVNCIKFTKKNPVKSIFSGELCTMTDNKPQLKGFNTDVYGFELSLRPLLEPQHKKALILGNGGAARAVKYVLEKLKIDYKFVSRKPLAGMLAYKDITAATLKEYKIIINSSPVGTFPNTDEAPDIPYEFLDNKHLLYDLIYNPAETTFLKKGKEKGAKVKNGYEMLELQALKSWEIWNS
jgi:shikimate dehydrogenase